MPVTDDDIRYLLDLAETEDLAEIEVHEGDCEVMIRRRDMVTAPVMVAGAFSGESSVVDAGEVAPATLPDNVIPLTAPMSGVFYRAASPDTPAYVEVGQQILPGDTLGLIEAMKLFNEIESEVSGKIVKVLVDDSSPVEFDQPLFLVDPS